MDQETVVSDKRDDGWKLLVQFDRDGGGVVVAFWIKTSEEDPWALYIASALTDQDPFAAYGALHASLNKLAGSCIAKSELRLISPSHPLAQGLEKIQGRHSAVGPVRVWGFSIGSTYIQAGLIYPTLPRSGATMSGDEIKKTLFDLLNRRGLVPSAIVTLQDGSSFQGVPFGIELNNNLMNAKFVDDASRMPRVVSVDDIASIQ